MVSCQFCVLSVSWTHLFFPSPPLPPLLCHCPLGLWEPPVIHGSHSPSPPTILLREPSTLWETQVCSCAKPPTEAPQCPSRYKTSKQSLLKWPTKISLSSLIFHLPRLSPQLCALSWCIPIQSSGFCISITSYGNLSRLWRGSDPHITDSQDRGFIQSCCCSNNLTMAFAAL